MCGNVHSAVTETAVAGIAAMLHSAPYSYVGKAEAMQIGGSGKLYVDLYVAVCKDTVKGAAAKVTSLECGARERALAKPESLLQACVVVYHDCHLDYLSRHARCFPAQTLLPGPPHTAISMLYFKGVACVASGGAGAAPGTSAGIKSPPSLPLLLLPQVP